jgi:tRNA pseudouridine65 synthase
MEIGAGMRILFQDGDLVAVDKPAGVLTHRTRIAQGEAIALQWTRDQLGRRVYPIHRLDRGASGVLLFALHSAAAREICSLFEARRVRKRYLAVVRGWPDQQGAIDYPLQGDGGQPARPALTRYRTLARVELPLPVGPYPTSRYALLEVEPETGRFHQIRRHLHHICHPLIGDTTHGEGRHNRLFRGRLGVRRMLLHARSVSFTHPRSGAELCIQAPLDAEWLRLLARLGWDRSGGTHL